MTLRLGAVYPQIELAGDPGAVRAFGAAVEDMGFDHLLAYDHVLGAQHADREPPLWGPYTEHDPFHDPFVLFAYLAGRTTTLRFGSAVLILPQRQTALVAKQAADLALLSGNRFRLGVGVGWNPVEYDALGQDFSTRGARIEEQIELLRRYWSDPLVTFDGRFDHVERAALIPRPTEPIPIWIGGFNDRALRRAARQGDGYIFVGVDDVVLPWWDRLQALLDEVGRAPESLGTERMVRYHADPADAAAEINAWDALGGTDASIVTMALGFTTVDHHIAYLQAVRDAL